MRVSGEISSRLTLSLSKGERTFVAGKARWLAV